MGVLQLRVGVILKSVAPSTGKLRTGTPGGIEAGVTIATLGRL